MRLLQRKLPNSHNLFFFGDKHDGSSLSSDKAWNKLLNMMNSEYEGCSNNFGAEGGDDIEAIMVDDKRFSPEKLKEDLPLKQQDKAVEKREAIAHMMLYKLQGNHCRTLWRFGDIMENMCKRLNVPYGSYSAKLSVLDNRGNLMYKIYDTHGYKTITSTADDPIRRKTNMELILKRQLKFKAADCVVMIKHHVHKVIVTKPAKELFLYDDGKQIKQGYTGWGQTERYIHPDARWYGCAGSFVKLYSETSGYAEVKEYDPIEIGFLVLRVRNKKVVSLDPIYIQDW